MPSQKQIQIQELTNWLAARTPVRLSSNGPQPPQSNFDTDIRDLLIIKPYGYMDMGDDSKIFIEIKHMGCGGSIGYSEHPTDPILSSYYCRGMDMTNWTACQWSLSVRDLRTAVAQTAIRWLSTILVEDSLSAWPIKLVEVSNGRLCYTTTRELTDVELVESRAKRMLQLREDAR